MQTSNLNLRQYVVMTGIALSGVGAIGTFTPVSALTFNFNPTAGTSQQARDGFAAAGALWSDKLTDNVTINIDIDFASLGSGTLAQAGSVRQRFDYSQVYTAMSGDRQSTDDNAAFASLSNSPTFNMLLNRTSNNPNGSGSAATYVDGDGDANNRTINMSNANAKALGLIGGMPNAIMNNILMSTGNGIIFGPTIKTVAGSPTTLNQILPQNSAITTALSSGADGEIAFSTAFTYDFNPNDGITAGSFDFVGLAVHEIGHVLGFTSGVDVLDGNSPPNSVAFPDDQFTFVNTLDLFRYSADSKSAGAIIDWTADNRAKYFSLDRGATNLALFSNGVNFGDGRQASHWKDDSGLGVMDPTAAPGERLAISENDLRGFDVIGWNRASVNATAVPEPADFLGTFMFAAFTAELVFKRRQKLFKSTAKAATEAA